MTVFDTVPWWLSQEMARVGVVEMAVEGDVLSVVSVNRSHPLYRGHRVWEDASDADAAETKGWSVAVCYRFVVCQFTQ